MRALLGALGALVLGIFLVIIGFGSLSSSGAPDCGGKTMTRSQTCTTYKGGKSTTRSYDEQKSVDRRSGYTMIVIGGIFTLGAGGLLIAGLVSSTGGSNKRPGPGGPPNPAPAGYQQGYPAPQAYPPGAPSYGPPSYGPPSNPSPYGPPPSNPSPFAPPPGAPSPGPYSPYNRGQ